jgi:hypothetical protein
MIFNIGILFIIITWMGLSIPGIFAIIREIPREGINLASALVLLLIILLSFMGLRILLDLIRLIDLTSDFLVSHIPGLKAEKRVSIVRALKEIIVVFILILAATAGFPLLVIVPNVGWILQAGLSVVLSVVAFILLYDAGRSLYAIFQSGIELLVEKLSSRKMDENLE